MCALGQRETFKEQTKINLKISQAGAHNNKNKQDWFMYTVPLADVAKHADSKYLYVKCNFTSISVS